MIDIITLINNETLQTEIWRREMWRRLPDSQKAGYTVKAEQIELSEQAKAQLSAIGTLMDVITQKPTEPTQTTTEKSTIKKSKRIKE